MILKLIFCFTFIFLMISARAENLGSAVITNERAETKKNDKISKEISNFTFHKPSDVQIQELCKSFQSHKDKEKYHECIKNLKGL